MTFFFNGSNFSMYSFENVHLLAKLSYQNDDFVKCKIQLNYTKVVAKLHIFKKYIFFNNANTN